MSIGSIGWSSLLGLLHLRRLHRMVLLLLLLLLLLMRSFSNELVCLLSGLCGGGSLKSFDMLLMKDMLLHHWLGADELG
jgi:hypothetical protein